MKKISFFILLVFTYFQGYSQIFQEGFESSNVPDLDNDTWNLGTTELGSNGIWGVFDNGVGLGQSWNINNGVATPPLVYEGANAAYMNRENIGAGNTSQDYLATPLITIPANGQLRFYTRTTINGDLGTKYKIMVAESPDSAPVPQNVPANYVLVKEWGEDDLTTTFNIYEEKLVDLSAYANKKVYVAFVMEAFQPAGGLNSDRWLVDKVRIVSKCLDPTNLQANNIGETTAELSWTNPGTATQWEVEVVPFASAPTGVGVVTSNNPYTATLLTPTTPYKFYVRALCSDDIPSLWVGPIPFTTSSPGLSCTAPIVIGSTPYSTTDTTGNYGDLTDMAQPAACAGTADNYMTGNDVFYSYTPTEDGAISITMTPTGNWSGIFVYDGCANVGMTCVAGVANNGNGVREIPSLNVIAGHHYIIVISTNATPQTVGYTMVIQTLNCAPPSSLSATGTGPTTANLSWANPGGASSWEVFIQVAGSPIPSAAGDTANTNTDYPATALTGLGAPLELGTPYQYWVRADCGDGTFSPWAGPYLFNTTSCSSGCNYSFVMTDNFGGWEGNTMTITQGALTIATIGDTFTSGTGPVTISVPLCDGPFELFWNEGGDFSNEVGIAIVNSFGQTIFTHEPGDGLQGQTLYSGVVDCANPMCLPPTDLSVAGETTFGATLSWIPNGPAPLSWDVYAVPAGDPAPTAGSTPTANTTNNPFTISGLLPDTTYVYYVRAVCSGPGENPWSDVSPEFTTLPTCPKPTLLTVSGIDLTQATFGWTAGGAEGSWQVIVLPAGSPPPTAGETGWTAAPTNPFTVAGLTSGTPYDMYVRAVCSESDISTWAGPLNFNTSICPAVEQCLYTFTMVDSFGDGWNENTISVIQNGVTVATLTGPLPEDDDNPVTIQIPLCHGVPVELFWNEGGFFAGEVGLTVTSFLGQVIFDHQPGEGLEGTTLYEGTAECVAPTCLVPTDVVVSNITLDSATITWTDNNATPPGSWDIIILPATAPAPLSSATGWVNVSTNPYNYSGLTSATNYKVYVRSVCSDPDKSFWSLGVQFNTIICLPSNLCDYTFIMVDSFGDGWNGNTMNVTQNGIVVATLTGPTFADDDNPISQTVALCNGVPVELFWNDGGFFATEVGISIVNASEDVIFDHPPGDDLQNSLLYSGTVSCVPPTCPKPVQLTATNVTETTATLAWVEATTATTWEVLILPAGSPAPTDATSGTVVTTNPYEAIGLISGTSYVFYVRAVCSDTDSSHWSGPRPFATLITNDDCDTATVVIQNPDQSCTQTGTGTIVGATPSDVPNDCGGTADDDVWFQFVATSTSISIDLTNIQGSTGDLYHILYSGECGTLNQMMCSDAEQSTANGLVVGQTYYIRVFSWTDEAGQTSTFNICIGTIPPPIYSSTTDYTPEQLVTDILLNTTCASVTNITYSTGTNFGSTNGIGYFEKNGSSFPFDNGIILSTGDASNGSAPGPNSNTQSNGDFAWTGDADLSTVLTDQGVVGTLGNATKIEFDFVPITDNISFNFLFASEEYGTFQCQYSDVFAFLLTNTVTGVTTNLAVVPNTTTPISVVNIRDNAFNGGCPSVNPEYFGDYYLLPEGLSPLSAPTNFNGITVPLTALADVTPGVQYHIKLAIADFGPFGQDNAFDSAVFLEGGSFGIGNINLGDNLLESTGNAVCAGGSTVLSTDLDPSLYNFQWFEGPTPIPGATTSSITVDHEATYVLQVNFTGTTCTGTDNIIVEFYDPVAPGTPNDLYVCDADGVGTFDLTDNTSVLLAPLSSGFAATYYLTFADASAETNAIATPTAYTNVTNPQTIYVRVENDTSGCYAILDFDLIVQDLTPQFTLPADFTFCSGATPSPTISVTPLNFNLTDATYSWTHDTNPLPDVTSTITITEGGLYTVTVLRGGCSATASVNVIMTTSPVADVLNDVTVCDSYTLPVLSANNAYYSGPGGTGSVLTGAVTTSQTVYIWAQLGTCTDQSSFVVTVNTTPDVQPVANVASCDGYVLPALAVGHYYSAPSGGGTQLDGQTITTDQTIYVYAQSGTAPAICFDQESFTVTITTSPVADDPLDVDACASYGLPALTVGNYFTAPAGGGTPHFAGDVITTSQTLYVYAIAGTCPDENSFDISIIADPSFTIDSGCHGSEYVLEVVPAQGSFDAATASYTWSVTGDGQILSGNGTQAIVISGAGDYSVTVTTGAAQCDHSETVTVDSTGCTIQKGISPNGDGMNDYFDLEGQNVAKLDIFNRYGTIVYKKSNYSTQWHGQSDGGDELPDGTYYYVIERAGGETKTGWIYINRERN